MKFLIGGRMGDAIHQLYVVKNTPGKHNIYITDQRSLHSDGFIYDLEKTIEELRPVLELQDYINSIQKYEGEITENTEIKEGVFINLNLWRRYVYSASWTYLLSNTFNVPVSKEPWINYIPVKKWFMNRTAVHCSVHAARRGKWNHFIVRPNMLFIGNDQEYETLGIEMTRYQPKDLMDMFTIIYSCAGFIGNQSLPLAIAHSLGVHRVAVLNEGDKAAYIGEEKIYSNFSYVI